MMKINAHEQALIQFMRENPDWVIGLNDHYKPASVRRAEIQKLRQLGLNMSSISSLLGISERHCYRVTAS